MKRFLSLFLSASLLLGMLTACGGGTTGEPQTDDTPEAVSGFTPGTTEGNTYTSSFSGLTFSAPEDWIFATQEEMDEMMGAGFDTVSEELDISEMPRKYAELRTIYEVVAYAPDDSSNILIMYENLGLIPGGLSMTEDDYADSIRAQLEQLESYDYDVSQETFHSELAGKTFTVLSAASDGINQDYYLLKIGSYMLCMIFTNGVYPAASGLTEYFSGAEAD